MGVAENFEELAAYFCHEDTEDAPRVLSNKPHKQALRQCQRFGMRLRSGWGRPYLWDGETLSYEECDVVDLYHELAHFQVASPEHRRWPEYGCGESVTTDWGARCPLARKSQRKRYEERASLLGALWLWKEQLPWLSVLHDSGWFQATEIYKGLVDLYCAGFIDEYAKPLFVVR